MRRGEISCAHEQFLSAKGGVSHKHEVMINECLTLAKSANHSLHVVHKDFFHALVILAPQIVLETEESNGAALRLYEKLGFVRDKRLPSYYLNGSDAFRLKMILKA